MQKNKRKFSQEHIDNLRKSHLGFRQSKEQIEKRVKKLKGKKRTREQIEQMKKRAKNNQNYGMRNKKHTIEWKENMSKIMKSRKITWGDKITQAKKGFKFSNKSKKKMSESRKKYFQENPEAIEKIKEHRAKQVLPIKDTSIERKIQRFLKKLGIEFFTHQYMKIPHGYQCDIFIPKMNLVIECDGNYWHKYPIGNAIDMIRTRELIDKGFMVLRFWGSEIREMGLSDFKSKLNIEDIK